MTKRIFICAGLCLLAVLAGCGKKYPQLPPTPAQMPASVPADAGPKTFIRMGDDLRNRGELTGAASMYARARDMDPANATPLARLGDVAWASGRLAAASNLYAEALRRDQSNPDALLGRARALAFADEVPAARILVDDLISTHGATAQSLSLKGMLLSLQGDNSDAQLLYREALAMQPGNVSLTTQLAYVQALNGDYSTSLDVLRPLSETQSSINAARIALADVYALSGQADVALQISTAAKAGAAPSDADRVFYNRLDSLNVRQAARALFFRRLPVAAAQASSPATPPTPTPQYSENSSSAPNPSVAASSAPAYADDLASSGMQKTRADQASYPYWAQIASFRSQGALEIAWYNLQRRNGALARSLAPRVEVIDIAGQGRFHRLYASGFETETAADQACLAIRAEEINCVIVSGMRPTRALSAFIAQE